MRVETYPNGGGKVLHMWQDEFESSHTEQEMEDLAKEFVEVCCKEIILCHRPHINIIFKQE
jgi:hypothetical protein